jgi:hypothetical protein
MRDPDLHQPEPHRHHADETTEAKPGLKRVGLASAAPSSVKKLSRKRVMLDEIARHHRIRHATMRKPGTSLTS